MLYKVCTGDVLSILSIALDVASRVFHREVHISCHVVFSWGVDLTNLCPDVCVKDSETDPFWG